ncbi:hypothetical protein [Cetobacterium sp.]|uniref:hypothetical protein n=1 Tax=Cetobacterium sp. TaxID=2071632 RepID=UPI003EE634E8
MESLRGRARQRPAPDTRPGQREFAPNYGTRRNNNFSSCPKNSYPPKIGFAQRMNERSSDPYRYTWNLNKNNQYKDKYNAAENNFLNGSYHPNIDGPHRSASGPYRPHTKQIKNQKNHHNQRNRTIQHKNEYEQHNVQGYYHDEQRPRQVSHPRASSYRDRNGVSSNEKRPKNNKNISNAQKYSPKKPANKNIRDAQKYSPKKPTVRGKQKDTTNKTSQQNIDFIPAPPKLKSTIKCIYKLIRLVHHRGKITTKVKENHPITFQRLTNLLVNTIKPAFPDEQVNQTLEVNAKNWARNTQLVLEQHYESLIESTTKQIREQTDREDWAQAFEVASTWAEKNYKGKVSTDTVEQVEALIIEQVFVDETVTQNQINQGTGNQTSPTLSTDRTTVSPPKSRGDWSFDEEDEQASPLDPKVLLKPIQAPVPTPRTKRATAHRRVPLVPPTNTKISPHTEGPKKNNSLHIERSEEPIQDLLPSPSPRSLERNVPSQNVGAPQEATEEPEHCEVSIPNYTPKPRPRQALAEKLIENPSVTTPNFESTKRHETTNGQTTAPANNDPVTGPTKHTSTVKKISDWSLTLNKKYVIIGDSNVAILPTHNCPDLQVNSFPGAKLQHAANLIEKATIAVEPTKIILSFGFNNRQQRYVTAAITELQKAYETVIKRLPNTEVFFPIINFAPTLPSCEQMMIQHLNNHMEENTCHIPSLPIGQFLVEADGLQWRAPTAMAILQHWRTYLNC